MESARTKKAVEMPNAFVDLPYEAWREWIRVIDELRLAGYTPDQVRELATSGNGERG
jgi:hypothetical protein